MRRCFDEPCTRYENDDRLWSSASHSSTRWCLSTVLRNGQEDSKVSVAEALDQWLSMLQRIVTILCSVGNMHRMVVGRSFGDCLCRKIQGACSPEVGMFTIQGFTSAFKFATIYFNGLLLTGLQVGERRVDEPAKSKCRYAYRRPSGSSLRKTVWYGKVRT